jgi:hypothetical protein
MNSSRDWGIATPFTLAMLEVEEAPEVDWA